MSNPFSQLNGYNYTNPYISPHTGYNGFTGPPNQQQNQFQRSSLVNSGYRQFQSANNSGHFGYLNGNNSDSNNQSSGYNNGYSPHNSSLNSSFGNAQASPGSAIPTVSSHPTNRNFSPGSPAFPPASPLYNPPPISPSFPGTAAYAPVLSPVTPPSSNGASPVLRKGPSSQVGSVPSRAQLNPLEELEAVTKQISAGKGGPSNLNTSGSLNRTLSPTDQFVQDLLNGKDNSVKTQPSVTNPSANTQVKTQQSLNPLNTDQNKPLFGNQVNPAFLQNNFPNNQPATHSGQVPLPPNLGYQQLKSTFPSTSQFCGQNGQRPLGPRQPGYPDLNHYRNPNNQGVPVPPNQSCPPFNGPPNGINGIRHLGNSARPPLLSPLGSNQVHPSFPPAKVPPDRNPAFRGVFDNPQQQHLHAQLQRQQQELQEKQKQLQKLQQQKLNQQRLQQFQQRPVIPQNPQQIPQRPVYPPGLQPIPRHPSAPLGFQPRPSVSQGLHPTSQRPKQVPPPGNFRPGFPPRNLGPGPLPPNFAYQGRPRNSLLPGYPPQQPPNQRPQNGTSEHLQYLQSRHPQVFSAYQQRFGNPRNSLPVNGGFGSQSATRPPPPRLPPPNHFPPSNRLPPPNKFQYLENRHPELLAAYRQRNPNSPLSLRPRLGPPNPHPSTPLGPNLPPRPKLGPPSDSVVRVEISPDQLNTVDQQEAWKRAEAFLKNELDHREQHLESTNSTSESTKTKPRNRLGSWHQPENNQTVPEPSQLELPQSISIQKLPQLTSSSHAEVFNPLSNLPESISIQKVANIKRERRSSAPDIARVVDVQQFLQERAEATYAEKSPLRPIKRERLNSDPTDTATYNAADTFVERSLQVKRERLSPTTNQPLYTPASSQVGTTVTTAGAQDQSVQRLNGDQTPLVSNSHIATLPSIPKTLSSQDYILNNEKSSIFDSLDLELQSLIKEKESENTKVKREYISPVIASSSLDINRYGLAAPIDYTTFAAEAEKESVFETDRTLSLVNFSSEISETRSKELVRVKAEVPARPTSTPSAQIPISDRLGVDLTDNMSGNPPKLPPGISLQRTPATPAPNLPPGISIQRSGDSPQLQKLPSSIQIQRPDSNESSAGMDRLAGLGIQISRSEEKPRNNDMDRLSRLGISVSSSGAMPSTPQVNKSPVPNPVPDRLSGLGISVSGGPKPQGISISGGPRLPPGVNVSGGPKPTQNLPPGLNISGGSPQNLPPGVNISGGPRPPQNLPPGMSISGGPRPKGPPGVNISGGPRPNMPPGVNISGGPRPNMPPGVNISGGPRPNLPPGVNVSGGPRPGNPPNVRMGGPRPQMNAQGPRLPPGVQISGGPGKKPGNGNPQENGPETDEKDDEEDSENEEEGEMPKENGSVTPGSEKNDQEKENNKEDEMDTEEDEGSLKVAEEETEKDKKSSEEKTDDTQENGEKEKPEDDEEAEEKDTEKDAEDDAEKDTEDDTEKDTEKEKPKEGKKAEKGKKSKPGENGAEGEGWEGYEGEGWEGYEGEEGWEGYEDEEGWEGYEGEEGWEGYEGGEGEGWEEGGEKSKDGKEGTEKKEGKSGEEGEEESKDTEELKEEGEEEKEEGEIEKVEKPKKKADPDAEDEEDYEEEMEEEEDSASSVSKDTDGAPKTGDGQPNAQRGLGSLGNISISRLSKEDDRPKNKLPPGISMSPVPSMPSLPPGISISSPSVTSGPPSNLPPGISISPFKKPSSSARHSVDDDSRSVNSMDRDNSYYREDSEELSIRSYSEQNDPEPLVGTETTCVFCNRRCGETKPKLLTCLHSACSPCFDEKIRISIRDNSANDVVDLDGEDIQMAPEVTCPICKATTSEDEVMDNYFASADDGEDEETPDEDQHICNSCEENAIATSKCNDCEEYLCNDCVRAHLRVKMTKDHEITVVATSANSTANLNYCDVHRNEKLTLFCESCDTLNCRDCQLSERHRNHKYRYSHEVAPEIKAQLMQSVSDIKLKRNGLEESRQLLSTKLQEVNVKENSLLGQLREVKSYLVSKIENRHKELVTEITKMCREKRKLLEGRKSTLDRTYWQADYGITFVNNVMTGNVTDEKMLLTKKMMSRQMKRLRRANNSVNLSPPEMEMKLDLYFQHFTGQSLHTNLDSVLKMVMSDIKVSAAPVEAPKPKPPPPAAPSPVRQAPSTPTRGMPQSPGGVPRSSPARLNSGMVNRNLGTPQKQIVARSPGGMRQPSPVRPMMQQNRNMQGNRMGGMQPRMGQPARGARGRGGMVQGGVRMGGQQGGMMGGRGQMGANRGRGPIRGGMVGNQGMTRGGNPQLIRGRGVVRGGVQQMGMRGGAVNRGGMQIRGGAMNKPRMIQPAITPGARRGRPPSGTGMNIGGLQRDPNAIQPLTYNPTPRSQNPQSFGQRNVKPNIASLNAGLSTSGSSWHTPTTANRPVSPPKSSDASSFKIKLPKMGGLNVKSEADADLISLDEGPPAKIVRPNGTGNVSDALATLNRTGIQISRQDEGVDPLGGDQPGGEGTTPMVSLNLGAMKSEPKAPNVGPIKIETGQGTAKSISQPTSRPIMEGSAQKEKADGDWCAVCHDGGDTLYCCDRCPKVYHLFCYVPPLTSEPPDDWVCLMCATIDEILSLPTKVKKGRGNLSERDLKLCRRLLFEMYNLWPESVPFRDCADLNFPQYLEKIKDPIALDVIKERLDEENPDQYSSVREFLADLRKMFRNCFLFNSKESEIYRHAKKLEEKLDQLLQMWLPEFAFDPLTDLVDKSRKTTKRPPSPQPGPSKKKRSNDIGVDFLGKSKDKKKKKKKRKRKHSDDNRSESDSDDISEGERERQDYLAALQMSLQGGEEDNDPRDGDFMPDEGEQGKGKGKGKGRGKGKRAAS